MSGELLGNPAVVGVLGGLVGLFFNSIWNRVIGGPSEKSIPTRLAEIDSKLAEINTKLEVAAENRKHAAKEVAELKNDFWDHMEKHHGHFKVRHTKAPTSEDSGAFKLKGLVD